jgi:hypothetical protein
MSTERPWTLIVQLDYGLADLQYKTDPRDDKELVSTRSRDDIPTLIITSGSCAGVARPSSVSAKVDGDILVLFLMMNQNQGQPASIDSVVPQTVPSGCHRSLRCRYAVNDRYIAVLARIQSNTISQAN